jgi:hypothetical protein
MVTAPVVRLEGEPGGSSDAHGDRPCRAVAGARSKLRYCARTTARPRRVLPVVVVVVVVVQQEIIEVVVRE